MNKDIKMLEKVVLLWIIVLVTCFTVYRAIVGRCMFSRVFMLVCLFGQLCALIGIITSRHKVTKIAHVIFTCSIWVGSIWSTNVELQMVAALAAFTWASRVILKHCMFSKAHGSVDTDERQYDLIYIIPLIISGKRLIMKRK